MKEWRQQTYWRPWLDYVQNVSRADHIASTKGFEFRGYLCTVGIQILDYRTFGTFKNQCYVMIINVTVVTIVEDVINYVTVVLLWIRLSVTLRIGFSCIKLSPYPFWNDLKNNRRHWNFRCCLFSKTSDDYLSQFNILLC